ncbi:enoyl-CoA hydratase-related protein [Rudaeicoccus suwonensis]|uniref:Enoyl-CoA hydratase n=1 Tax=Rudaeicoccus suwonensis TaxID=657409 RepID=A0A561E7S7_9MICO|nr:enoyl-CoA hydratase-related protein [Rudaeicoccus suwonensis]TWE11662.1 enoyl-CoA hydratase [Rudaeicoccus suwonensis]
MSGVQTIVDGPVVTVRFDAPERLNAVGGAAGQAVIAAVEQLERDDALRVLVLTGTGRAFSSGADLTGADGLRQRPVEAMEATSAVIRALVGCSKPVVAAVNGLAAGVAVGYVLAADIAVAAQDSYLLLPFTGIGLMPDGGTTVSFAASAGRARAMRAALLGEKVPARQALEWGLISQVCTADELDDVVAAICRTLVARPAAALTATKRAVNAACLPELDAALDRERDGQLTQFEDPEFAARAAAFVRGGRS